MAESTCPECWAPLVSIEIHVGAGKRTLCSCAQCDRRWWVRDGSFTDLDSVKADLAQPLSGRFRPRP